MFARALPFAFAALAALTFTTFTGSASAAETKDDLTAEARARFNEGVAEYDQGHFEAARAKFLQAFALRRHPDILLNLGWSSLRCGRRHEAAQYFRHYLDETPNAPPEKRADAERGLAEAERETSTTSTMAAHIIATGGADEGGAGAATPGAPAASAPAPSPVVAESRQERPDNASAKGGFGVNAMLGVSSNELNLGLGVRGGVTLAPKVYVGGAFVYNLGHSVSATTAGVHSEASASAFYVGPEAGYDLTLGSFVVRPYAGIGLAILQASATGAGTTVSASDSTVVFWPGGMAVYELPHSAFSVGADLHLVTIPGGPAMCLFAMGGARF